MAQAIDVILRYGQMLLDGDLGQLAERYHLPCAISMRNEQHRVEDPDVLTAALTVLRDRLQSDGVKRIQSRLQSQVRIMDDTIIASVEADYLDDSDTVIDQTRTSYVMRDVQGTWKIVMLSVDRPISNVDGLCLSQEAIA